jgi:hypothetical protein
MWSYVGQAPEIGAPFSLRLGKTYTTAERMPTQVNCKVMSTETLGVGTYLSATTSRSRSVSLCTATMLQRNMRRCLSAQSFRGCNRMTVDR